MYKKALDRLKTEPALDDAEGLTDAIMQRVERTVTGGGAWRGLMRAAGMASGIAASALICFMAYETLKYPVSPVNNFPETKWEIHLEKRYPYKTAELNNAEKAAIIENTVKSRKAQKERLNAAFIAYHKKVTN
jgi:hypothetical protein